MTLKRQDTLGSELVVALEGAWEAIRREHPDLPRAVLITGSGSLGTRRGVRLGHFAASRWQTGERGPIAEIFIGGEGLARGARPVLATLLPWLLTRSRTSAGSMTQAAKAATTTAGSKRSRKPSACALITTQLWDGHRQSCPKAPLLATRRSSPRSSRR